MSSTSTAPPTGGAGLSARQVQIRGMIQALGMLPVLFILAIAFHYLGEERFLSSQNLSIVAQQASINIVLAAGMTFVILTGGIDLSVGSVLAFAGLVAAAVAKGSNWRDVGNPDAGGTAVLLATYHECTVSVTRRF